MKDLTVKSSFNKYHTLQHRPANTELDAFMSQQSNQWPPPPPPTGGVSIDTLLVVPEIACHIIQQLLNFWRTDCSESTFIRNSRVHCKWDSRHVYPQLRAFQIHSVPSNSGSDDNYGSVYSNMPTSNETNVISFRNNWTNIIAKEYVARALITNFLQLAMSSKSNYKLLCETETFKYIWVNSLIILDPMIERELWKSYCLQHAPSLQFISSFPVCRADISNTNQFPSSSSSSPSLSSSTIILKQNGTIKRSIKIAKKILHAHSMQFLKSAAMHRFFIWPLKRDRDSCLSQRNQWFSQHTTQHSLPFFIEDPDSLPSDFFPSTDIETPTNSTTDMDVDDIDDTNKNGNGDDNNDDNSNNRDEDDIKRRDADGMTLLDNDNLLTTLIPVVVEITPFGHVHVRGAQATDQIQQVTLIKQSDFEQLNFLCNHIQSISQQLTTVSDAKTSVPKSRIPLNLDDSNNHTSFSQKIDTKSSYRLAARQLYTYALPFLQRSSSAYSSAYVR